jgi:RNA polymerase sigma factor (sigma-70 family)
MTAVASRHVESKRGREIRGLIRRYKAGELEMADQIVNRSMGLILRMARRFQPRRGAGFEFEDLVQAGRIGALRALERFDCDRNAWSTYARWWIRLEMQCTVEGGFIVKVPRTLLFVTRRLEEIQDNLPSASEEVAVRLNRQAVAAISTTRLSDLTARRLPARPTEQPDVEAGPWVLELVQTMGSRLGEILVRRYGLDGHDEETFAAIGRRWGISRERVRVLHDRAIERLREQMIALRKGA